jgi:hypothetical protein
MGMDGDRETVDSTAPGRVILQLLAIWPYFLSAKLYAGAL